MKVALVVMAKQAVPGQVKTRLSPPLNDWQAARLYEAFLRDSVDAVRQVQQKVKHLQPFFACTPESASAFFHNLAPDFSLIYQWGDNLGERLDHVLSLCLSKGYQQVVAMNSDSPTLPADHLIQAFDRLSDDDVDIVFGPAEDGGYYLIGLTQPWPRLVRDVQMSTPTVLEDTLRIAKQERARVALLPRWYDVDTATELERLYREIEQDNSGAAHHTRKFMTLVLPDGWFQNQQAHRK